MREATGLKSRWTLLAIGAVLACWLLALPLQLNSENTCSGTFGQNGVYNATCNNGTPGVTGSPAFIDASMLLLPNSPLGRDLCDAIYRLLSGFQGFPPYPSTGAVIDARGVSGTTNLTCTHGSPWTESGNIVSLPSTILLPATGSTSPTPIIISTPWILPANTHLIGEGNGIPSTGFAPGTTIQAANGFSGSMIQFGSSSACPQVGNVYICTGISVENLTLDGQGGQSINGITNGFSQDFSSVNHVSLYQIVGKGLVIQNSSTGNANNSGPYSSITFDTGGATSTTSTVCAQIFDLSGTHGIHGLSCTSESSDPSAAILLDSSNNSLGDVRIVGFHDGISVGSNSPAYSNVLLNIYGDTTNPCNNTCPTPINVVHITNHTTVSDLSIMGVRNAGGAGTTTIQDDLTATTLPDATVGIYVLGESADGGYSRYTTSPNAATWVTGTSAPSGTCARGSLYSCINAGQPSMCNNSALWACALSGSTLQWLAVE
jgi:hypothetical protein